MEYHETPSPDSLRGLVKAFWTLDAAGSPNEWIEQQATPDGCIELIARLSGRSRWRGDQPAQFVVGLNDTPVRFEISGDARFAAIRLWPWTWRALSGEGPDQISQRWRPVSADSFDGIFKVISNADATAVALSRALGPQASALGRLGSAILGSRTAREVSRRTGMSPRQLQRWFAHHVGLAPRTYLRFLRFQQAFTDLHEAHVLAQHAADHGFADQAHMAREFRSLAGEAASYAKARSKGPFLS